MCNIANKKCAKLPKNREKLLISKLTFCRYSVLDLYDRAAVTVLEIN